MNKFADLIRVGWCDECEDDEIGDPHIGFDIWDRPGGAAAGAQDLLPDSAAARLYTMIESEGALREDLTVDQVLDQVAGIIERFLEGEERDGRLVWMGYYWLFVGASSTWN